MHPSFFLSLTGGPGNYTLLTTHLSQYLMATMMRKRPKKKHLTHISHLLAKRPHLLDTITPTLPIPHLQTGADMPSLPQGEYQHPPHILPHLLSNLLQAVQAWMHMAPSLIPRRVVLEPHHRVIQLLQVATRRAATPLHLQERQAPQYSLSLISAPESAGRCSMLIPMPLLERLLLDSKVLLLQHRHLVMKAIKGIGSGVDCMISL